MTDPIGEDEDAEGIVEFRVFVPRNRKEIIICNALLNYNIFHESVIYNYLRPCL